jgi:hypothetical protein
VAKDPSAALRSTSYPRSVSWAVDPDYVRKLSPDERVWLAQFLDRYYGGDFRGESSVLWTDDQRRERYRAKNVANRDLYTQDRPEDDDSRLAHLTTEAPMQEVKRRPGRPRKTEPVEAEAPSPAEVDVPVVEWLSIHRAGKKWVLLACKSAGDEILERTVLAGPCAHLAALNFFRVESMRRWARP